MGEHAGLAPVKRVDLDAYQKHMSQRVEKTEENLGWRMEVLEEKMDIILRVVSGSHGASSESLMGSCLLTFFCRAKLPCHNHNNHNSD